MFDTSISPINNVNSLIFRIPNIFKNSVTYSLTQFEIEAVYRETSFSVQHKIILKFGVVFKSLNKHNLARFNFGNPSTNEVTNFQLTFNYFH